MANIECYEQCLIRCASHAYPIYIGSHLLSDGTLLKKHVAGPSVLIVTNETIAPLYLERVSHAFFDRQCDVLILPDGEAFKNAEQLQAIYDALITHQHHRDTTLIALGGGVIGDLTGFAAATYHRGVAFIQLPTTLLADVDAAVGGKTALNHPLGKNLIGAFHQPQAVIIDVQTLTTLPAREFQAGFAEVIKYALLVGGACLLQISKMLSEPVTQTDCLRLAGLIAQACLIKASFVEADERELGRRALLNLGHTFAHALESLTQYQRWLHGEAVAIGLYCAALLSYKQGALDKTQLDLIDSLLQVAHLPRRVPKDIDLKRLQAALWNDKKIKNKTLRFVLIRAPGDCYLEEGITEASVREMLLCAVERETNHAP